MLISIVIHVNAVITRQNFIEFIKFFNLLYKIFLLIVLMDRLFIFIHLIQILTFQPWITQSWFMILQP